MNNTSETIAPEAKSSSFLRSIKSETAEQHALLESDKLLLAIMAPAVTAREYYCYLRLMKKVEAVYEQSIVSVTGTLFPLEGQVKSSHLIEEDITAIGFMPLIHPGDFVFSNEKMSMPFMLGVMYVMKGSKLGGKVISRHIHRTLGFSENNGAKYINNYGVDTIAGWKTFLSFFSAYAIENKCSAEIIHGARCAFGAITDFFKSNRL